VTTLAAKTLVGLAPAICGLAWYAPWQVQQEPDSSEIQTRNLWNTAFSNQRPAAPKPHKVAAALGDSFVGVTLWRMRLSKPSDPVRFRGLVHDQDPSGQAEWTPERVALATAIQSDELLRLSIESARRGRLYVIDRDIYPDGTFGKPELVFPTTRLRGGDNHVEPGLLIEIPDAQDKPPAFRVEKTRPGQTGVLLTIIVAPAPIPGLAVSSNTVKLTEPQVAAWERRWGSSVQRLDQKDPGKVYTTAEAAAATRGERVLRAEDPIPSTLFHCHANRAEPMLIKVPLKLGATTP
jgi:hypothetical protein